MRTKICWRLLLIVIESSTSLSTHKAPYTKRITIAPIQLTRTTRSLGCSVIATSRRKEDLTWEVMKVWPALMAILKHQCNIVNLTATRTAILIATLSLSH